MRPEQLDLITGVSGLRVHPDGSWAVVAVSRPSFEVDDYVGQLWKVPLSGGRARRITRGRHDTSPRFSPDGRLLGFLRPDADSKPQVFVVETSGGEPVQVTDQHLGVTGFEFTPDARRIVFTALVPAPGRYGTLDGVPAAKEDPRLMTTYDTRENGAGWTYDKPSHLFEATVPDLSAEPALKPVGRATRSDAAAPESANSKGTFGVPAARQLTGGDFRDTDFAVRGDGGIVFTSARQESDEEDLVTSIYELSGDDAAPLTSGRPLGMYHPVVSGDRLYALGEDLGESGLDFVGKLPGVFLLGGDTPRRVSDAATQSVIALAPGAGGDCLGIVNDRGAGVIHRYGGEDPDIEIPVPGSVLEARQIPGSPDVLAVVADATSCGEVVRIGPLGDTTVLTDFSKKLRTLTAPIEPQELTSRSDDGYRVHGWVLVPEGPGPHPVLLLIHGGPAASYGPAWFDEAQVYASAGYAVVMCNPRGSDGYGAEHSGAIRYAFGNRDMADVLGFLEHAVATVPGLDGSRVGVMGGSYGGYLTAWIIGHDHRWAGAIVERGYLDPWVFIGSSDIGWYFPQEYNGRDKAMMDEQSPMIVAHQVSTPTLVLHSEQDQRCPLPQAFQYHTLLKQNGVETQMLVFPGETHELSRSGSPWHRRQRFDAILRWWHAHLPVAR